MGKFIKSGKIVIILQGRMAGKKAVVVKTFDDGTKGRQFGHCLVAGVKRAPLKVTTKMSQKKVEKRTKVKPFVRYINYTHIMPTRYNVPAELEPKSLVSDAQMETPDSRVECKKALAKVFREKFSTPPVGKDGKHDGGVVFLSKKMRF